MIDQTGQVTRRRAAISGAAGDGRAARGLVQSRDGIDSDGRRRVIRRRRRRGAARGDGRVDDDRDHRVAGRCAGTRRSSSSRETTASGGSRCWSFTRMPSCRMPRASSGAYDLFVRRNLDNRIQNEIRNARGRRHRRRARARRGTGSAADRRADHRRAARVGHRDRQLENRRRDRISGSCCRWGSRCC